MLVLIALIGFIAVVTGFIIGLNLGGSTFAELICKYYPEEAEKIVSERYENIIDDDELTVRRLILRGQDKV